MKFARYVMTAWCLLMGILIVFKMASAKGKSPAVPIPARGMRAAGIKNSQNDSSAGDAKKSAWQAIESNNYQTYIDNLRATGCPEETVRDIITSDVNKYYELRLRRMHPGQAPNNFWEFESNRGAGTDVESGHLEKQLNQEKTELLRFLLGTDWDARAMQAARDPYEKGFLNTLSQEKRVQIHTITEKYSQLRSDLFRKGGGFFDEDLKSDMAALASNQRGELAMTLTQAELEQWELRYSETARGIRFSSGDFQPSEEEFKVIFHARRMMEQSSTPSINSENYLRAVLGESRYQEYKREQDRDFQNLKRIAVRFELPPGAAEQVHALKLATESASTAIRSDISLSEEARGSRLQQLKQSVTEKVTAALGDRAAKVFLRDAGWLRNIH